MANHKKIKITPAAQARIDAILNGRPLKDGFEGLSLEEAVEIETLRAGVTRSRARFHVALSRGELPDAINPDDVITWADVEAARRQRPPQAA